MFILADFKKNNLCGVKMVTWIYRKYWHFTTHGKEKIWSFGCSVVVWIKNLFFTSRSKIWQINDFL
jgi:hypothetical protein